MKKTITALSLILFLARAHALDCVTSKCHSDLSLPDRQAKSIHGPFEEEGCKICHLFDRKDGGWPKAAGHPALRPIPKNEINGTCLICHEKITKSLHKAIQKDTCVACHNPHKSKIRRLLRKAPEGELCLDCHKNITAETAHTIHDPLKTKDGCMNCHDPHSSSHEKLLKAEPKSLCLKCHDDIKKLLNANPVHHKPIQEGKCTGCHHPHGSTERKLLKSFYTDKSYVDFSEKQVELCLGCHKTFSDTQFRNGSDNLHELHIKTRSCRVCHEIHASKKPKLVREHLELKGLKLPLIFERRESGGSCTTACHGLKQYDRIKPADNAKGR